MFHPSSSRKLARRACKLVRRVCKAHPAHASSRTSTPDFACRVRSHPQPVRSHIPSARSQPQPARSHPSQPQPARSHRPTLSRPRPDSSAAGPEAPLGSLLPRRLRPWSCRPWCDSEARPPAVTRRAAGLEVPLAGAWCDGGIRPGSDRHSRFSRYDCDGLVLCTCQSLRRSVC
jgi:hypothetical protein